MIESIVDNEFVEGVIVQFVGYLGDVDPILNPGQLVVIDAIEQTNGGLGYRVVPVDDNGNAREDVIGDTLFLGEFCAVSAPGGMNALHDNMATSDLDHPTHPDDEISLDTHSENGSFWELETAAVDPDLKAQHEGRNYRLHPITDRFPEMSEAAFEELKADIEECGQLVPIVALPNAQIIDGKHRFRACRELGIPPLVEVYTGPQDEKALFAYVRGLNARRRHLTAEELKAFAVKRKSEGVSQKQIAQEAGVTQSAISKTLRKEKYSQEYSGDPQTESAGYKGPRKSQKSVTATEKQYDSLLKAWNKASKKARDRFIEEVGLQLS